MKSSFAVKGIFTCLLAVSLTFTSFSLSAYSRGGTTAQVRTRKKTPRRTAPQPQTPPIPRVVSLSRTHIVTVNSDGTFSPQNLIITPGDKVRWEGLRKKDAIVQIADPASAPNADVCGIRGNRLDHRFNEKDVNEFTGPMRVGVSGIFALGPNGPGLKKLTDLTQPCACETDHSCKPDNPTVVGTTKLCFEEGEKYIVLDETWANPDITGVIFRLNWSDLQKEINGKIKYDWDDLDRLMDLAVANGKLFTLDVRAGFAGTPDWIFTDYPGAAGPGPVTPHTFKDWAEGDTPPLDNCGFTMVLGAPTDAAYRNLYNSMIERVADHVKSDSRWFQALAHVKVSGLNLMSSEARLPNHCPAGSDGTVAKVTHTRDNGTIVTDPCVCNSKVWADASYTPEGLYEYYRFAENTIFNSYFKRKSIGYQLIQAGFPKVASSTNFEGDYLHADDGFPFAAQGTIDDDIGGAAQTTEVIEQGRLGRFVDPLGVKEHPDAGRLFVVQHSGLQPLPDDTHPRMHCVQHATVNTNTMRADFPLTTKPGKVPGDNDPDGCPNPWAVREGLDGRNQIMGFQTTNGHNSKGKVASPADVESAFWNLTINSNGVFVELYEERLWEIFMSHGSGPSGRALSLEQLRPRSPLINSRMTLNPTFTKTLHDWVEELHWRRRQLATPQLPDPFPNFYEFTFSGTQNFPQVYYYINPAKCSTGGASKVGSIRLAQ